MQWLALQYLWLLSIIPAIIILYLLKRKYENVEISSILLWQKYLRNQEANRPWQKLQRNLLLLLQLLVASLLIMAMLKPAIPASGAIANHTVVVIDSSGSMLTLEGEQTRLELAKQELDALIRNLGSNQEMTIIEVKKEPKVLISQSSDKAALLSALSEVQPRPGIGDTRSALSLARSILASSPGSGIMWFGDGDPAIGVQSPELLAFQQGEFKHVKIGKMKENLAIAAFVTVARQQGMEALIRIDNHGSKHKEGKLKIINEEQQTLDVTAFEVKGHESYTYSIANLPQHQAYQAVLEVENDGLLLDNELWSVPFSQGKVRVALVAPEGNRFLSQALTLGNRVELTRMEQLPKDQQESFDIWVFDGVVPEELPKGNILMVAPKQSTSWFDYRGESELTTPIEKGDYDHSILQYVDWNSVHASAVQNYKAIPGLQSFVQAGEYPIVSAGTAFDRRMIIIGFDLHQSDFPLHHGFPIFIQNSLSWLAAVQSLPIGTGYPGEEVSIPFTLGSVDRTIIHPDGSRQELPQDGSLYLYSLPEQVGLYTLEEKIGSETIKRYFPVQMRESESMITPNEILAHGSNKQEEENQSTENKEEKSAESGENDSEGTMSGTDNETRETTGSRELTLWVAFIALCLALTEWVVYQRGY